MYGKVYHTHLILVLRLAQRLANADSSLLRPDTTKVSSRPLSRQSLFIRARPGGLTGTGEQTGGI